MIYFSRAAQRSFFAKSNRLGCVFIHSIPFVCKRTILRAIRVFLFKFQSIIVANSNLSYEASKSNL